jgi:hypothetical protein
MLYQKRILGHYKKLRGKNVVKNHQSYVEKTMKLFFLKLSTEIGGLLYIFRQTDKV